MSGLNVRDATIWTALLLAGVLGGNNPLVAESLDEVTRRPFRQTVTKTEQYRVVKYVWERVPVWERYGRHHQCWRLVYRWVRREIPEVRTRTVQEVKSFPSLFNLDGHAEDEAEVTLDAPESAGAIAEAITGLFNGELAKHPMVSENGGLEFPVNRLSTGVDSEGVRYHIVVATRSSNPRKVDYRVAAFLDSDRRSDAARPYVESMIQKIRKILTK